MLLVPDDVFERALLVPREPGVRLAVVGSLGSGLRLGEPGVRLAVVVLL